MLSESSNFPKGIFLSHFDLPRPINWRQQFGNDYPLHLEIGFGFGEFLIAQSGLLPKENFIGVEQDWARMGKCLAKISSVRKFKKNQDIGENLRLLRVDATVALQRLFVPFSLDRVTCLFPCPWPKKAHIKYRLFSRNFLLLLNSRLKEQGTVKLVTDWQPYLEWILSEVKATGFDFRLESIAPQFNTKFERKWQAGGQESFSALTLIKTQHQAVAIEEDIALRALFVKDFYPQHFVFDNIVGEISVIYKDFIFDQKQNMGLVRLIVAEPFLTQPVWIAIVKTKEQWCIAKAEGHNALPTSGVALAIENVFRAAQRTSEKVVS